jgi:tRNA(fMet)-specific endonuclease VapC
MSVRYLLDTNICIYIMKHTPACVREQFHRHSASEMAISAITLGELRFGAEKSNARDRAIDTIQRLESTLNVMPLGRSVGVHYAQIRAHLQSRGTLIGNNDLWIAAHARSNDWTLVTNNIEEFQWVPDLRIENWVHSPTI